MGKIRRGVLIAAFTAVAVCGALGIKSHFFSGSSQPAESPSTVFNHYSTATGNDVTLGAVQPAAGECPVEVVALKGPFTIVGKSGTHRIILDNITAKNIGTVPLYGFSPATPAIAQTINTAENTGARLVVRITNEVPDALGCYASTMPPAGQIASARLATPPRA